MDKKLHKACSGTRDIISSMPDDVLVRILSCLKTKDAIKTCVLSTRWKDLWTFIFNLEFDDFNFGDDKTFKFQNYVEKVLSKCQCGDIQSFRLRCSIVGDDELSYPIQWIIFAIEHKVRKLIVSVDIDYDDDEFWSFRLPQSILSCNTLVELTILSDFYFDISDSMTCFPSLKVLYLSSPHPDVDMMQNLFRSCPVLEDLTIYWNVYSITEDALTFNILVPTLKWLKIHMFMDLHDFEEIPVHKFVVTARELQYLMIDDSVLASYVVNESPLLNEASLSVGLDISDIWWFKENLKLDWYEISKDKVNPVMELLSGVKYTKTLSLSSGTMNFLNDYFDDNMPLFPNLVRLELFFDACWGWECLLHLLNNSGNLEVLILEMDCYHEYYHEEVAQFLSESPPSCLRSNVKTIKIKNMRLDESDLDLVAYMLKNGEVLNEFHVEFMDIKSKKDLKKKILKYPRGSAACKICF